MKNIMLNNAGLKLLALLLAVVTWAYVVLELHRGAIDERDVLQSMFPYSMVSKKLPVELNVTGVPQSGYSIAYDKIVVRPSEFVIVGPKAILDKLSSIKTQPVDISGYSRTLIRDVAIIPPTKGSIKEKFITVTIPILKEMH